MGFDLSAREGAVMGWLESKVSIIKRRRGRYRPADDPALAQASDRFGQLDVLFSNAGISGLPGLTGSTRG
jgi:NAD(P)-dependent dehydrogenase (short-subunit alcohol dehydrogenase family)